MNQTVSQPDSSKKPSDLKQPSRRQKILVAAGVLGFIVLIFFILKMAKPQLPEPELQDQPTLVNTAHLNFTQARPGFTTVGQIKASAVTDLRSQVTGVVAQVLVDGGEQVQTGQPLIQIDPTEQQRLTQQARAQFELAKANLAQAQAQQKANVQLLLKEQELSALADRNLERFTSLQKRSLATDAQVDQANELAQRQAASTLQLQTTLDIWPAQEAQLQAQFASAQSILEQAEQDLQKTQILAPFDGVVQSLNTAPATRVTPGMSLITLVENDNLVLEVSMPQTAQLYLQQFDTKQPDITAIGKVWGQDQAFTLKTLSQGQSISGASLALFEAQNPKVPLPVNRAVNTTVSLPMTDKAYAIPVVALHDHKYIYLLDDSNLLQRTPVTVIGETYDQGQRFYLIAADGIAKGSQYVVSQMVRNVNGMRVQPTSQQMQK